MDIYMQDALFMKTKQTGLSVVTIIKIMLKKNRHYFPLSLGKILH